MTEDLRELRVAWNKLVSALEGFTVRMEITKKKIPTKDKLIKRCILPKTQK